MHAQWSRTIRGHAKMLTEKHRRDKKTGRNEATLDFIRLKGLHGIFKKINYCFSCEAEEYRIKTELSV